MFDFTREEVDFMIKDEYKPGFMKDIQNNDLVAIPPISRTDPYGDERGPKVLVVTQLWRSDGSYYQPEEDRTVPNTIMNFVGVDKNGQSEHCSYGNAYPCWIKRNSNVELVRIIEDLTKEYSIDQKIQAIKELRALAYDNLGVSLNLREAKDLIDRAWAKVNA